MGNVLEHRAIFVTLAYVTFTWDRYLYVLGIELTMFFVLSIVGVGYVVSRYRVGVEVANEASHTRF